MNAKTVNILGIRKKVNLYHTDTHGIYMIPIDSFKEQTIEENMDNPYSGITITDCNNKELELLTSHILLYGDIDLRKNDDIDAITSLNIINYNNHNILPNYNYITGNITNNLRYETWDDIKWFKYNYCLLGKPKKVLIYKLKYNKYA